MAESLGSKVPDLAEVEKLRDVRDAAWAALGDAQRVNSTSARALDVAHGQYDAADAAYCAARLASGTTQQPR
jgi:hypothetical protein